MESNKRPGIPPTYPHIPPISPYPSAARSPSSSAAGHNFSLTACHSRSLSQPSFFNLDTFPPFNTTTSTSPSPSPGSNPVSPGGGGNFQTDERVLPPLSRTGSGRVAAEGLPPRKAHRRSQSDIPFNFSAVPPPLPPAPLERATSLNRQYVKLESDAESDGRKSDGDDLLDKFMNLDSLDTLNNSSEDRRDDLDSRASGTRTNGADSSENEAESSSCSGGAVQIRMDGNKRSAAGDPAPISMTSRHYRSLSMDSFMGKLNFGDELQKLPPSPGIRPVQHSHSNSLDGTTNTFSLEFGNGEFSAAEMKKIMTNEKLVEIAAADPKRAKRILANRQSAARSKERKMRYISELEHKVQTLQTEATTLSAQLTLLQRDSAGLTSQNNELKFRLQAMEQQAQLRDALNEALTAEVQHLKLVTGELTDARLANNLNQQMQLNPHLFQMQQLQKQQQIPMYQMQQQQQQHDQHQEKQRQQSECEK